MRSKIQTEQTNRRQKKKTLMRYNEVHSIKTLLEH